MPRTQGERLVEDTLRQDQLEPADGSDYAYQAGDGLRICNTPEGILEVDCAGVETFEYGAGGSTQTGSVISDPIDMSCLFGEQSNTDCERADESSY